MFSLAVKCAVFASLSSHQRFSRNHHHCHFLCHSHIIVITVKPQQITNDKTTLIWNGKSEVSISTWWQTSPKTSTMSIIKSALPPQHYHRHHHHQKLEHWEMSSIEEFPLWIYNCWFICLRRDLRDYCGISTVHLSTMGSTGLLLWDFFSGIYGVSTGTCTSTIPVIAFNIMRSKQVKTQCQIL